MQHIDKLEAPLREWIRVLMLPPEQIEGTAELKRRRIDSYMTEKQRRVLRLFYGYNLTMKEMSALLGAKYKAVDVALYNARNRLRKLEACGQIRGPAAGGADARASGADGIRSRPQAENKFRLQEIKSKGTPPEPSEAGPVGTPRSCKTCAYRGTIPGHEICDYIGMTGRSRVKMGAKKENGSCRLWAGKTAETTALVRALRSAKLGSVPAGERGLED